VAVAKDANTRITGAALRHRFQGQVRHRYRNGPGIDRDVAGSQILTWQLPADLRPCRKLSHAAWRRSPAMSPAVTPNWRGAMSFFNRRATSLCSSQTTMA
jgi:hypothetical protein